MSSHTVDLVVCVNPSSWYAWVNVFFWYRFTGEVMCAIDKPARRIMFYTILYNVPHYG